LVRRSKTDQEGEGFVKVVAYGSDRATSPVRAAEDSLALSGVAEGAVFRPVNSYGQLGTARLSDFAVAVIIKHLAKSAGLPTPQLAGHSLRAGFVTEPRRTVPTIP
jgi:hypothetical protein